MNSRKPRSSAKVTFYFTFYSLFIYVFYIYKSSNRRQKILSLINLIFVRKIGFILSDGHSKEIFYSPRYNTIKYKQEQTLLEGQWTAKNCPYLQVATCKFLVTSPNW